MTFKEALQRTFEMRHLCESSLVTTGVASSLPTPPAGELSTHNPRPHFTTLPFVNLHDICHTLPPATDKGCRRIAAEDWNFANPAWETGIQQLAQQCARAMGVRGDHQVSAVTAVASHMLVRGPNEDLPRQWAPPEENELGTLIVSLPSRSVGGELVVETDDNKQAQHVCEMGSCAEERAQNFHFAAFFSDMPFHLTALSAGVQLMCVYSLQWDGDTAGLKKDVTEINNLSRFQQLVQEYRGECITLELSHRYAKPDRHRPHTCLAEMTGADRHFVEHLHQAQEQFGSATVEERFEILLAHWTRGVFLSPHDNVKSVTIDMTTCDMDGRPHSSALPLPDEFDMNDHVVVQVQSDEEMYSDMQTAVYEANFLLVGPTHYGMGQELKSTKSKKCVLEETLDLVTELENFEEDDEEYAIICKDNVRLFFDLLKFRVVPWAIEFDSAMERYDAFGYFDDIMRFVAHPPALRQWLLMPGNDYLTNSRSYEAIFDMIELFDFWGDDAVREKLLKLFTSNPDDEEDKTPCAIFINRFLQRITPSQPTPVQAEAIRSWAEEACKSLTQTTERDGAIYCRMKPTHSLALLELCMQTSQPVLHLLKLVGLSETCRNFPPALFLSLDQSLSASLEWAPYVGTLRSFFFDLLSSLLHESTFYAPESAECLIFHFKQGAVMPNGHAANATLMDRVITEISDINARSMQARQQILEACHELAVPRMEELYHMQRHALLDAYRRFRVMEELPIADAQIYLHRISEQTAGWIGRLNEMPFPAETETFQSLPSLR